MLPGTLCDDRLFAPQVAALEESYDVAVGDLTRDDTIAGMAKTVLASSPERFSLAGLSLGGIVALEMIRQEPHRIDRLALLDTNPGAHTEAQTRTWDEFEQMVHDGRFEEITRDRLLDELVHTADPRTRELVVDMARAIGPEAFLRQNAAQPTRRDSTELLASITCPTLVMCGAHEQICPVEMHVAMAAAIPHADLVVLHDAGHLATLDNPDGATAALQMWLQRPATGGATS